MYLDGDADPDTSEDFLLLFLLPPVCEVASYDGWWLGEVLSLRFSFFKAKYY